MSAGPRPRRSAASSALLTPNAIGSVWRGWWVRVVASDCPCGITVRLGAREGHFFAATKINKPHPTQPTGAHLASCFRAWCICQAYALCFRALVWCAGPRVIGRLRPCLSGRCARACQAAAPVAFAVGAEVLFACVRVCALSQGETDCLRSFSFFFQTLASFLWLFRDGDPRTRPLDVCDCRHEERAQRVALFLLCCLFVLLFCFAQTNFSDFAQPRQMAEPLNDIDKWDIGMLATDYALDFYVPDDACQFWISGQASFVQPERQKWFVGKVLLYPTLQREASPLLQSTAQYYHDIHKHEQYFGIYPQQIDHRRSLLVCGSGKNPTIVEIDLEKDWSGLIEATAFVSSGLKSPEDLAVHKKTGDVYVSDDGQILIFSKTGEPRKSFNRALPLKQGEHNRTFIDFLQDDDSRSDLIVVAQGGTVSIFSTNETPNETSVSYQLHTVPANIESMCVSRRTGHDDLVFVCAAGSCRVFRLASDGTQTVAEITYPVDLAHCSAAVNNTHLFILRRIKPSLLPAPENENIGALYLNKMQSYPLSKYS